MEQIKIVGEGVELILLEKIERAEAKLRERSSSYREETVNSLASVLQRQLSTGEV